MAKRRQATTTVHPDAMTPTPERLAADEHVPVTVEDGIRSGRSGRTAIAMRLKHVSLVDRWHKAGLLDEAQVRACERYAALHRRAGFRIALARTGGDGLRGAEPSQDAAERATDARLELARLAGMIGRDLARWELVVLHDKASALGRDILGKSAYEASLVLARHVTATVSAELVARWGMAVR